MTGIEQIREFVKGWQDFHIRGMKKGATAYHQGAVAVCTEILTGIDNLLTESEDERIRKWIIEDLKGHYDFKSPSLNPIVEKALAWLEKQKINTEGDFGRGYDCGYEACLNSHGAEWFEKQKEQKPIQSYEEKEYVRVLKSLISDFIRDNYKTTDINFYQRIYDWLDGRHIEQKPVVTHGETYHVDTLGTQQVIAGKMPQKPELIQHPPITYTYPSDASRDERLKAALLALLNSDLLKVKEGGYFTKQDLIEWVERIPTDKPAEWSEEDEKQIAQIERIVKNAGCAKMRQDKIHNWLKSLRPSWKPSEEQIYSLGTVVKGYDECAVGSVGYSLKEMYEQLKKLM